MTDSTTPTTDAPRRGRKYLLPAIILLGGLAGAMALVFSRPQPQRAATPRMAPMVTTDTLGTREAPLVVEGTGTVRPTAEISLSSEVSGRVVFVARDLVRGGSFAEGDTLLTLENVSYRNAVAVARAEVEQRRVDLALAGQNQLIAEREYDLLRARTGAEAPADTSLAARLARQQPQFEAAEASLARAEAQLSDARLNLRRTVITAPFDGRVRSESVDVGQVISPGQAIADIYSTAAVEVDISLSTRQASLIAGLWNETSAARIPASVRAEFGGTWHEWKGFVEHAAGALDPTTRTVEVVLRVPSPFASGDDRPPLLIGSYVRASIEARAVEEYYAIPRRALRDGSALWVVSDEGTLSETGVSVVQEVQDSVFLRAELPVGTRYVVSDLAVMTEGMQIRMANDGGTP
ncbi:MAG: efflux RND transporter periplasmic adaptor subunit [Gemmatimonadetes bacterium]|nr:efflux RND transporter periplasmic adaptor subunit [Gemmatimonadota bacterium]